MTQFILASLHGYCFDHDFAGTVNRPCSSVRCPYPWHTKTDEELNFQFGINRDGVFVDGGCGIHGLNDNETKELTMRKIGQLSMQSGDLSIPI